MKKDKLEALQEPARRKDREQGGFKDEQLRQLRIYYAELVSQLGRLLKLRQRVIATAQVFLKRFYLKNSLLDFDPNLVVPTCLYLAAKVEECTTPGRVFDAGMRRLLGPEEFPYETRHILECEFYLLEELSFQLVVYHPYRPLAHFLASQPALGDLLEPAHAIVNDSYRTDASLMYPPYVIALAAIYLAACARERDVRQWFAELNVDMNEISKLVAQLLDLYELWPQVNPSELRALTKHLRHV
jgi:cyclin C